MEFRGNKTAASKAAAKEIPQRARVEPLLTRGDE